MTTNLSLGNHQYSGGNLNLSLINEFKTADGVTYYLLDANANGIVDGSDKISHVELDKFLAWQIRQPQALC